MTSKPILNRKKDWSEDFSHENGFYQNRCVRCKSLFMGHKRRVICKQCTARAQVMHTFKPPFTVEPMNMYVFDSNNQMVCDVRAHGFLQYKKNGEAMHDELAQIIADALNDYWEKDVKENIVEGGEG